MKKKRNTRYALQVNNHSVYLLTYHLVLVVKYSRRVITPEIAAYIEQRANEIGEAYQISIKEFGYEPDHIHLLFNAAPTTNIPKFINAYKASTSRNIFKNHPEIATKLWKNTFWSPSYCITTTGGAPLEKIEKYINSQQGEAGEKR